MLIEAGLPNDVDALRTMVIEQSRRIDVVEGAEAEIERLRAIIEALQRHRFGRRSDQLNDAQFELGLEDIETALAAVDAAVDSTRERNERPRKTNRGSLPAHLERIEQLIDIEDKACPCCGGTLHQIGEDVSERLDVIPTTFLVRARFRRRRHRHGSSRAAFRPKLSSLRY